LKKAAAVEAAVLLQAGSMASARQGRGPKKITVVHPKPFCLFVYYDDEVSTYSLLVLLKMN
jgi:hypothetical protein